MNIFRAAAVVVAMAAGAIGVWRGTWAVGGSDSSCYGLMAQAFARGDLQPTSPLATAAPWPAATTTFAPGGFIPSPRDPAAASPVCAAGFSLLLAPLYVAGGPDGIFLLAPIAGAVLVYLTFGLGARLVNDAVGLASAITVAASPVFVFQVVQPMNDVTVAALWLAILVLCADERDRTSWIGALTGLAILIRPNLAPAAIVVAIWCARGGVRQLAAFGIAATPFVVLLLTLNAMLYAHPLGSGYGAASDLFAVTHLPDNLRNYGRSLLQTQLAFPLLGFGAVFVAPEPVRRRVWLAIVLSLAIVSVYVLYRPLPEWWYLRFLLPAFPVLTALAFLTLVQRRSGATSGAWVALLVAAVIAGYGATSFAMRDALDLHRLEHRFRLAGLVAKERLPANAVYLTVWESGSVRFHAEREALVWDSLDPASLDAALQWLTLQGREPYIMIEDWEEAAFRDRFSPHSAIGQLDWPPRYLVDRRVRIYRPGDRAAYWDGHSIPTEYIAADRP